VKTLYLTSLKRAVDDKINIVYFALARDLSGGGVRLAIRISVNGRLVGISWAGKMLHDRSQREKGGKCICMPSVKVRKFRDIACAAVAFTAMGNDIARFPPQEFDL
jgi:hypothetical protein